MKKEELKNYFLTNNKSGYKTKENHIKNNFDGLLNKINIFNNKYFINNEFSFTQKLYNFLYDIIELPKCETCGVDIKWKNRFTEGYYKNCSKTCRNKSIKRLERIKETNIKRYNVDSPLKVNKFKDKRNKTLIKNFGTEKIFSVKSVKEKSDKTNLFNYNTIYPMQSDIVKNRRINNTYKKYGVTSTSKLDFVKEKLTNTVIKKYGVDSVMKVDKFKEKNIKSRTADTILKYKKKLGDHIDINYIDGEILVKNQCKIHKTYKINKTLFYYRVLVHEIKNPCIHCNPVNYYSSIKENEIKEFIENELFLTTKKIRIDNKEIDIYVDKYNFGIEFNGLYWHSNLYKDNKYHLNKSKFFKSKNINIIQIFEDEWIHKKNIVKSILKNKFNLINNKIYGRKCLIKEIDNKLAEEFLNKNHLQGSKKSKNRIGLFYENELVSLMTFSKGFRCKNDINDYELVRFCNKIDSTVIGGASKLLKYFINNYKPKKIITFADKRYSDGDLYIKLGFYYKHTSPPNFWYFKKHDGIRYHRFNFRKKVLIEKGFDKTKTGDQIMLERGYLKIYDCGNIKFEMILN